MDLKDASEDLKRDREIVMVVFKQHGIKLEFASEDIQIDREIVTAALNQYGQAL